MSSLEVKISIKENPKEQARTGVKRYTAFIVEKPFAWAGDGDTPQEALVLASMAWDRSRRRELKPS